MSELNLNPNSKFIFITGGVVSSLGKGLASASLAAILQARGYKVRLRKLDPYLNVDPGTMNPCQHGEVFVTDDGTEADLDLGHYERFSGVPAKRTDSVTTGKIYQRVLEKERHGSYLGSTIQVIPHVTNEIKEFILSDIHDEDLCCAKSVVRSAILKGNRIWRPFAKLPTSWGVSAQCLYMLRCCRLFRLLVN